MESFTTSNNESWEWHLVCKLLMLIIRAFGTQRQGWCFPAKRDRTARAPHRGSRFCVLSRHDQLKWSRKTRREGANTVPSLAFSLLFFWRCPVFDFSYMWEFLVFCHCERKKWRRRWATVREKDARKWAAEVRKKSNTC